MAINPKLITALQKRMGVTQSTVYAAIRRTAAANRVTRELGALLLAGEHGLSIQRYASKQEMAQLQGGHRQVVQIAPDVRQAARTRKGKPTKLVRDNSVFVVHGRDGQLVEDVFAFLRAIGLSPMEWTQAIRSAKGANPHVDEVIEKAMTTVQGVVVVFSPDESAKLKPKFVAGSDKKKGLDRLDSQPRPNVIFEAGLALGAHSDKTLLVQVGDIREISDIAGKHIVHLSNDAASRKEFAQRLETKLKFKVDLSGDDWLSIGDFNR